jgi:hypothetical protein
MLEGPRDQVNNRGGRRIESISSLADEILTGVGRVRICQAPRCRWASGRGIEAPERKWQYTPDVYAQCMLAV